jgi:hypothetical protein
MFSFPPLNELLYGTVLIHFIDLFGSSGAERKVPVIHNLCLQLAASLDWSLGRLEKILPPPLMLYLLQAYLQVSIQRGRTEFVLAGCISLFEKNIVKLSLIFVPISPVSNCL